jgi:hypothetical protein
VLGSQQLSGSLKISRRSFGASLLRMTSIFKPSVAGDPELQPLSALF